MEQAGSLLASVVDELDPDRLTGADATALYGALARAERLVQAGKALLSPRIEQSGTWKEEGHRDAASLLASLEGVSAGEARRTLELGRRLASLPATEAAMREGELSRPKLTELTGAGLADPAREAELLEGATEEAFTEVRARCRQVRATAASADPDATLAAIHARRHFTSWTDAEGAFCYQGRDTADRGAKLLAQLAPLATALRRARRTAEGEPDHEPECALRADALFALVTRRDGPIRPDTDPDTGEPLGDQPGEGVHPGSDTPGPGTPGPGTPGPGTPGSGTPGTDHTGSGTPGSGTPGTDYTGSGTPATGEADRPIDPDARALVERPPPAQVIVRVDLEALRGGHTEPGQVCEVVGQGPIPVPMARDLLNDAFVALCFHRAGDIRAISHLGRTINATLRTALVERDRTCVAPGCTVSAGLEIDHVVPIHEGGPTELDNLALLCHHDHRKKTYEGWVLSRTGTTVDGTPTWSFERQPEFGKEPGLGIDTPEGRADWLRRQQDWQEQRE